MKGLLFLLLSTNIIVVTWCAVIVNEIDVDPNEISLGNACTNHICLNGGQCVLAENNATCSCTSEYTGTRCQYAKSPSSDMDTKVRNMERHLESSVYSAMRNMELHRGRYMNSIMRQMRTILEALRNETQQTSDDFNVQPVRQPLPEWFANINWNPDHESEEPEREVDLSDFVRNFANPCFGSRCPTLNQQTPQNQFGGYGHYNHGPFHPSLGHGHYNERWTWPTGHHARPNQGLLRSLGTGRHTAGHSFSQQNRYQKRRRMTRK